MSITVFLPDEQRGSENLEEKKAKKRVSIRGLLPGPVADRTSIGMKSVRLLSFDFM